MKKTGLMVLGVILVVVGPLVFLAGTAYTLMLPNIYESRCRISVHATGPQGACDAPCPHCALESSSFLRTQIEIIQSKPMLYEVINRLNLQREWGREGERLPRDVAYKILQNSVTVLQHRDTSLIVISVKRDNPNEAAKIANELATTYRDSRLDLQDKEARESIDKVRAVLNEQRARVDAAEKKVTELGATNEEGNPYQRALTDLESERFIYDQLNAKLREKIIALKVPRNPVEIIDLAEPNMRPVSPNLFMNTLLSLAVAVVPTLAGIVLVVVGATRKRPEPNP